MIYLEEAKNGSLTCRKEGQYLHSKYNPEEEADKFAASLKPDFTPFCIIAAGPCLSHCLIPLRRRFPSVPVYAVHYASFFIDKTACSRDVWDGIFCTEQKNEYELSEELFESLGEELIFGALFTPWLPAERIFPDQSRIFWAAVKLMLRKSRDVLATRAFFSRSWLKNTVRFFIRTRHICGIEKGGQAVLAAASGPSLAASIPYIKKYRSSFFLIGLSSALSALIEHNIYPDLCISTDGGFYAEYHLRVLQKLIPEGIAPPLAVSAESRIASAVSERLPLVPLRYNDGIESLLFDYCAIPALKAARNGSVSGTAAELALSLTSGPVYFCGLDLENGKGYKHVQPNILEKNDALADNRLKPLLTRLSVPADGALDIYRQWFASRGEAFSNRLCRLSVQAYKKRLGPIRDVSWDDIKSDLASYKKEKPIRIYTVKNISAAENKQKVRDFLYAEKEGLERRKDKEHSVQWYKNCAPLAYLSSVKYPESAEFKAELDKKVLHIFEELFKLCT
ncbi:6-hydroxymethylpterin diphosphokinase MptE-like protein [Treponema sp. HNW]|uniref:6-hydroxymethylpterin diphosphokinase MptE-like protein n=1 Tax=Treponema sp. HNW TaxID=3116654 RepID=UPI003D0F1025